MTLLRDAATWYAALGVPVVGFTSTAGPDGREQLQAAKWRDLDDADKAAASLARLTPAHNVLGLVTGIRFDVIDLDSPAVVDEALLLLGGQAPPMYGRAATPSGGEHWFIPVLGRGNGTDLLGTATGSHDGLDYRGRGGLVFAAPSVRVSKRDGQPTAYRWLEVLDLDRADVSDVPWRAFLAALEARTATVLPEPTPRASSAPDERGARHDGGADPAPGGEYRARQQAWALAMLDGVAADVAQTREGGRNAALNHAAMRVGHFLPGGWLSREQAEGALFAAAVANGDVASDGAAKARRTIRSGLDAGAREPHDPKVDPPRVLTLDGAAPDNGPATSATPTDSTEGKEEKGPGVVEVIINMARRRYTFGRTLENHLYALPKNGHVMIPFGKKSTHVPDALNLAAYQRTKEPFAEAALNKALGVLAAAARQTDPVRAHRRVAEDGRGGLWIDLGDAEERTVHVTAGGWTIEPGAPVMFRRTNLTQPMPDPAPGGTGAELWELLNVAVEDRALLWAWMVSVIAYPDIPHPIVVFSGEQGTGKSTAARLLVRLLDPSTPELHAPPSNAALWESTATGSYVVALDNLSTIKRDISDLLCRAVTGEGFVKRELYTDGDHAIAEFRSALILTGIDLGGVPNDLAERLLTIELEPVEHRRTEADLNAAFDQARPALFGALLDAAARVRAVDALDIELPRMADFAQVVAKLDHLHGGDALARYAEKDTVQAAAALAADPFTAHLVEHLEYRFEGKAGQLREELQLGTFWNPVWWPRTPHKMAAELKRAATSLRKLGWTVERHYDLHVKGFNWIVAPPIPAIPAIPATGSTARVSNTRKPANTRNPPQAITPSQPPVAGIAGIAGISGENPGVSVPGCRACGQLLDPVLVADGHRTHPGCPE